MINNPFDQVRATLVITILLGVMFFLPVLLYTTLPVFDPPNELSTGESFTLESLLWATTYPLIALLLWLVTAPYRDELADSVFNIPAPDEIRGYLPLSISMIISSIGFTYLLFYPLSLLAPDLVKNWLLDVPYLLYWDEEGTYLLGNLAGIIVAIVFAPRPCCCLPPYSPYCILMY